MHPLLIFYFYMFFLLEITLFEILSDTKYKHLLVDDIRNIIHHLIRV